MRKSLLHTTHKSKKTLILLRLFMAFLLLPGFTLMAPTYSYASVGSWQKGVTFYPGWNGEFGSDAFKQAVKNVATTHANYITLIIPLYQSNTGSTDIQTGGNTPTDDSLISAITYIHGLGLHVMLKPHIDTWNSDWRANINPGDRTSWFTNYTNILARYARIAAQYNVEDICIGTELIDMTDPNVNSTNTGNWKKLISTIRGMYGGKLTYSANWGGGNALDEKRNLQFWDALDYIGISAYFNFYGDNSVQNLKNQWNQWNTNEIAPLSQRWGKQVVFTEIGYRSVTNAHTMPWDYNLGGGQDQQEQANDYQALFEYWDGQSFMQGVDLWQWNTDPNSDSNGTGYTPQNKSAQSVMTTWFGKSGGTTTPPPTTGNPTVTDSVQANPSTVNIQQSTDIAATITNKGSASGNIVVDVEVYNSGGGKVFQKYYDNQSFTQGQSQTYHTAWAPTSAGSYTVKVGVFNYNWSQQYFWDNNAATVSTTGSSGGGGGTTTPPPPPSTGSTIEIWWPTQGANIGGNNVPFKGLLKDTDISQYSMYWQVDGGGLVNMPTNNTDYPHKEFDVDLTSWKWQGNGPYHLNFVAKDSSGKTVAQKPIDVTVWH